MKLLFCLLFCCLLLKGYSQFYLCSTEEKVKKEAYLTEGDIDIQKDYTVGNFTLKWRSDKIRCVCAVVFNPENISCLYIQHPYNEEEYNRFVRLYNQNFVRVSSTQWRYFVGNIEIKIMAKSSSFYFSIVDK